MVDAGSLINHLRLNPNKADHVIDALWIDFYNQISDDRGAILLGQPHTFISSVNRTLVSMDLIYNAFKNDLANFVWVALFNKIKTIGMTYYIFVIDKKFIDLEYRYSPHKIANTESTNEAMLFLGLKPGFSKIELLKAYRKKLLIHHPDKGGDERLFFKLKNYKENLEIMFVK